MAVPNIGRVGVWSMGMRFGDHGAIDAAAQEVEQLGYGALWIPGGIDDAVLTDFDRILAKTSRIVQGAGCREAFSCTLHGEIHVLFRPGMRHPSCHRASRAPAGVPILT